MDLGVAVTGGVGDIGSAIGRLLAEHGARVRLLDIVPADEAHERTAAWNLPTIDYVQVDVRDRAGLDAALAGLPRLDVAIGNAGVVRAQRFLDIDEKSWTEQIDINLTGVFNLCQSAARLMVERSQPGHVILTGSWVGDRPWPEDAAYSASKAGLTMMARTAALELARHGVRVNVVAPGIVEAGLAGRQLKTEPQYAARARAAVPLGEFQTAQQVAQVVQFLCSPAASYLTGSVLVADGGASLGSP